MTHINEILAMQTALADELEMAKQEVRDDVPEKLNLKNTKGS
jgi:hypothetical protein